MITEEIWDELAEIAQRTAENAYAPYSKFHVGSALLGENGEVYAGCNVENASFGGTICAERSSICTAVSSGTRRFRAIAIYNSSNRTAAPCGICRQVLAEFCDNLPILLVAADGTRRFTTLDEMLPERFGPSDLTTE